MSNKLQISIEHDGRQLVIRGPFCKANNTVYRELGGTFSDGAWHVHVGHKARIEEMFGAESPAVLVEVPNGWEGVEEAEDGQLTVGGYLIADRSGRDAKPKLYGDLIAGSIPASAGSAKHPAVDASSDAVFEMYVRREFAVRHGLTIVEDDPFGVPAAAQPATAALAALRAELERLVESSAGADREAATDALAHCETIARCLQDVGTPEDAE